LPENPTDAELNRAASDPTTPQATLGDLAYDHPELRVAIALNPATYEGLLEWLGELDDSEVQAALKQRIGVPPSAASDEAAESAQHAATCRNCSSPLRTTANYCGNCGTLIPGHIAYSTVGSLTPAANRAVFFSSLAVIAVILLVVIGSTVATTVGQIQLSTAVSAQSGDSDSAGSGPLTDSTRVSTEPANLPACPSEQTPISFSTWDTGRGATLVCQGADHTVTVVLILGGKTYTSTDGRITPTGYYASFGGGTSVDIGLGGWAAWVGDGGKTTLHAATNGWQTGDNQKRSFPALSSDVEACPGGTYPLSLSTWHGGWLLTCGETATAITRFVYVDGSAHGSGRAMSAQDGQSCGTDSSGHQVCMSANPAVVTFSMNDGSQAQHSVDANYVVGEGFSGAGKGTGAYGLADPQANATSEVAYLNGILQQSQAARASVKTVVQNILKCASTQSDVQNAQAVAADRTTELHALNSAPVDAVPGGAALVSQLQAILQDSLAADQAYVTAAGQVAGGQCDNGKSTYNAEKSLIAQITSEKTAFANAWNSQIAPQYGTPTYTQDDI
jgi:hypothetical protein